MKYFRLNFFILGQAIILSISSILGQQSSIKLPSLEIMEQQLREDGTLYKGSRPGDVIYEDGDYTFPPKGEVIRADWKNLQVYNRKIGEFLAAAPDDQTGKRSSWYGSLQTWKTSFDQFIANRSETGFFALIPTMVTYVSRKDETPTLAASLEDIEGFMQGMGYYIIRAMANHVIHQQAVIGPVELNNFIKIFSVPGFVAEGDWEEEKKPIDAAGVIILDPAAVVTQLKSAPWEQAGRFLGGATTSSDFFSRYTASGDGLSVLKAKYAANESDIISKFSELKSWIAQQERKSSESN